MIAIPMNMPVSTQTSFSDARQHLFEKIKSLPFLMYDEGDEGFDCEIDCGPLESDGKQAQATLDECDVAGWCLFLKFTHREHGEHQIKVVVASAENWDLVVRISSDVTAPEQEIRVSPDDVLIDSTLKRVRNIFAGILEGVQNGWLKVEGNSAVF